MGTLEGSPTPPAKLRARHSQAAPHAFALAPVAALVALAAFAAYVWVTAPTPYLLDSAELAAASYGLGVAHPPGEALALLWGKLFALLPLGSVAFRVGLGQAAAGAVAAALVFVLTARLLAALDGLSPTLPRLGPAARAWLAAAGAAAFALAPGAVFSANRPEVYALASALGLGALACATADDPRGALGAALLVGLGAANHPLLAAVAGLGVLAAATRWLLERAQDNELPGSQPVPRLRLVAGLIVAGLAGLLVLVYLPLRTAAVHAPGGSLDTLVWGDARSASGLWWLLSARTFLGKNALVQTAADPAALPFVLLEEVGPAALLALYGLYVAARSRPARPAGLALLVAGTGATLAALVAGLDPGNPDIRGYLGLALAALAVLGAIALGPPLALLRRPRAATWVAAALALAATVVGLARLPAVSLRHARAADTAAHQIAAELPPRAVLFTSHFETGFLLAYARLVEGRRPDVDWIHLGFARGPGYFERVAAARPLLAPLVAAHAQARLGHAALYDLPRLALFEPDEHMRPSLRVYLLPAGPGFGLHPPGAPLLTVWPDELFAEAARDRLVRGFLGWRAYQDALWACAGGPAASRAARQRLDDLHRLLPSDERARALAATCRDAH